MGKARTRGIRLRFRADRARLNVIGIQTQGGEECSVRYNKVCGVHSLSVELRDEKVV